MGKSVKNNFSLWAGFCVLVTVLIVASFSIYSLRTTILDSAVRENTLLVKSEANAVELVINREFEALEALSQTLSAITNENIKLNIHQDKVVGLLGEILLNNEHIEGVFTYWEPGSFRMQEDILLSDQSNVPEQFEVQLVRAKDGSFLKNSFLEDEILAPDGKPGEWYDFTREDLHGHITDPYFKKNIDGSQVLLTTIVEPIISNNEFYGVVGYEIALSFLQELVDNPKHTLHLAEITIISSNGIIAGVTGKSELAGQHIETVHADYQEDMNVIRKGQMYTNFEEGIMEFMMPVMIGDTHNLWSVNIQVPTKDYTDKATSVARKMAIMSLCCIVVALLLFRYISSGLVGPLTKVVELADALAKGDLTKRLEIKRDDEVGVLARALNDSCASLSKTIAGVKDSTDTEASAALEMSSVSAQMASNSEEMSVQAESVANSSEDVSASVNSMASAAEEMSVNIQNVSSTAEQLSTNMASIASSLEQMSTSIKEVALRASDGAIIAQDATKMSDKTTQTMDNLGNAAEEIGEVTNLIKRIAEQTNLLALNATIEAASAGDAGKGFAVVANEIKELANQSGQAASDIAERIKGIQQNTDNAIKSILSVSNIIAKINEASSGISRSVKEQNSTTVEITESIKQASGGTDNIATSIAELSRGANDVSKSAAEAAKAISEVSSNIQGMSVAARESNVGAQQVNKTAEDLARIAAKLQADMERFKV